MKFTAKYEIVELLASGRVSTFLVRDRTTQDEFVVHTFDCPAMPPGNSQQPGIFKHFASLAPSPAGRILEVGFDEASASAYVVTNLPAAAALQNWIRSYRAFAEGKAAGATTVDENATAELSATEVNAILSSNRDSKNPQAAPDLTPNHSTQTFPLGQSPSARAQTKGEFTRLFEDIGAFQRFTDTGAQAKAEPKAPQNSIPTGQFEIPPASRVIPPPPVTAKPSEPGPGSFTREFFLTKKNNSVTPDVVPTPVFPTDSGAQEAGPFTREFFADASKEQSGADPGRTLPREEPRAKASQPATGFSGLFDSPSSAPKAPSTKFDWTPPEPAKNNTGEFTNFFRGPFDQPGTSKKFDTIPDLADSGPAGPPTGEFTKIFGNESPRESAKFPQPEPLPEKAPGSFTQIFGNDSDRGAQLGVSRLDTNPGQSSLRPLNESSAPPLFTPKPAEKEPSFFSPPAINPSAPKAPSIPSPRDSTLLYRANPADATDVFRVPGGADAPAVEAAPSGPSEFTVFLSRSQVNAALPPEPVVAPPPAPSVAPPQFAFPPPPLLPPLPAAAAPPMPQFGAPPVPKPPAGLSPAASYWPLITVLTILIAVGALMVMYFAFKH